MPPIRSIAEGMARKKLGDYLRLAWIFEKWYEKLLLIALILLGWWKIFEMLLGLI